MKIITGNMIELLCLSLFLFDDHRLGAGATMMTLT